jgi:hypothetical protein
MIELRPDDFRPLDTFVLRWRWTDPKWALLPAAALVQIRPLTEAKAREVWKLVGTSNTLFDIAQRFAPTLPTAHGPFTSLSHIEAADPPPSVVAQQLAALVAPSAELVVVVWQPTETVAVAWEVFCAYWGTFCYPASDDISVRPLDETWYLEWHHDEYFLFGHV